jgi:hypothetical protein
MPFDWDARADCTAWFCKANVAYITVETLALLAQLRCLIGGARTVAACWGRRPRRSLLLHVSTPSGPIPRSIDKPGGVIDTKPSL